MTERGAQALFCRRADEVSRGVPEPNRETHANLWFSDSAIGMFAETTTWAARGFWINARTGCAVTRPTAHARSAPTCAPGHRRSHPRAVGPDRTPQTARLTRRQTTGSRRSRLPPAQRHRAPVLPPQTVARPGHPLRQDRQRLPGRRRPERRHRMGQAFVRRALVPRMVRWDFPGHPGGVAAVGRGASTATIRSRKPNHDAPRSATETVQTRPSGRAAAAGSRVPDRHRRGLSRT